MVAAFDQSSLDSLLNLLKTAGDQTQMPSFTAPVQILCYFLVQILLGLASAILFLINCSAFILYGVTALFGPIFVPLLMTRTFRAKFFHFLDVLISFAMIRAVAAAFIFVWAGFLNGFIQQTFNGNYSMEMWLANLIPCTMVFIAFIINMLFIPSMTQAIFWRAAGMAGSMGGAVSKLVSMAAVAVATGVIHVLVFSPISVNPSTRFSQADTGRLSCSSAGMSDRRPDLRLSRFPRSHRKE